MNVSIVRAIALLELLNKEKKPTSPKRSGGSREVRQGHTVGIAALVFKDRSVIGSFAIIGLAERIKRNGIETIGRGVLKTARWRLRRLSRQRKSVISLLIIFSALMVALHVAVADVEELLTQLNGKPAEERQKLLVENARQEGMATFYSATNFRDTQEIVAGFNTHYPFIKVAFLSLGGPGVLNKALTEFRAGMYEADVVTLTGGYVLELVDKRILAKYKSPMVPFLRKGFVDPAGYWPGIYAIGHAIIYNSRRVSAREAPKRYEDLLGPRWKGSMIMDAEAHDLLAGLIDLWGEGKASIFLKTLAVEQKVRFARQSHTFMTQLVASGEYDLIVDGYIHNAVALKEKGAPVDFVFMNPTIVRPPSTIAITSHAPHPYAAALFLDYYLSKEASGIMVRNQGRWAPRKDVPWMVEPETELHVVSALEWGHKMRHLVELFNKMAGQ